jgi:hypothetical protein
MSATALAGPFALNESVGRLVDGRRLCDGNDEQHYFVVL